MYFKLVDIGPSSGMSKDEIDALKVNLHDVESKDDLSKSELELIEYFRALEKNNLLESPFIYLQNSGQLHKIFLSAKEYEKVKSYSRAELDSRGKKVEIELEYELKDSIYYSDKILKVTESSGKTPWSK